MITDSGKNLYVLIITETGKDWQTFATWYSFYKNLPDAKIAISCLRTNEVTFAYFQWAKRLKVPVIRHKPLEDESVYANWLNCINLANEAGIVEGPILVVRPLVMALDALWPAILEKMGQIDFWIDDDAWFLNNSKVSDLLDKYFLDGICLENSPEKLCPDANQQKELANIATYKKGCGKWIHTAKGCPFSSAAGLVSDGMTVNEQRIVELWKKMVPLYSAVV